jgi:hypothetical protein
LVFGLGAFAGMLAAGAVFLGAATLGLLEPRAHNPRQPVAAGANGSVSPQSVRIAHAAGEPAVFDVAIDRRHASHAPFGLRLTGSDATDIVVVLSNLPPAAQLSRGERRGDSTWALKAADLADLHLALAAGAPEAFDIRIDVVAPPGMAVTPSVAKVRLVGSAPTERSSQAEAAQREATPPVMTAAVADPEVPGPSSGIQPAATTTVHKIVRPPRRTLQALVADAGAAGKPGVAAAQAAAPPPWTEAPSALGATSRGDWGRQVWWQLPLPIWPPVVDSPPAWSPFLDPPAHR